MTQIGAPRRPCQWASLHAGEEFLPAMDLDILQWRQAGLSVDAIAVILNMDPLWVEHNLARTCRTLATWERNACKWATRFVALEPMVAELGDNRERVSKQRPGTQKPLTGIRV
jgi:hypothetical protein